MMPCGCEYGCFCEDDTILWFKMVSDRHRLAIAVSVALCEALRLPARGLLRRRHFLFFEMEPDCRRLAIAGTLALGEALRLRARWLLR